MTSRKTLKIKKQEKKLWTLLKRALKTKQTKQVKLKIAILCH